MATVLASSTSCDRIRQYLPFLPGGDNAVEADSTVVADSVVVDEPEEVATETVATPDPAELLAQAVPTYNEIYNTADREALFRNHGFSIKHRKEYSDQMEEYVELFTATYSVADGVDYTFADGMYGFDITINGAPELLEQQYTEAKRLLNKEKRAAGEDEWWIQHTNISRHGNTFSFQGAGD